jgi:glycine/D-amino acid oxidase-like deaminating enzyme
MAGERVVVVGAGAFGGWTALQLLRRGVQVVLLDAWGPGNSRASSGGETRVIRAIYGPAHVYVEMVARAFALWAEAERRWGLRLYHETGVLWMTGADDAYVQAALPALREAGFPFEALTPAEAQRRHPVLSLEGVRAVLHEPRAGFLLARRACEAVVAAFEAEGGEYRQRAVTPGEISQGSMREVGLSDGQALQADAFVFACGPWLGTLFPDVLGQVIRPTRQDVFFFGSPAGDERFERLPVWVDLASGFVYGIPGGERRGFKLADDARGEAFDPTAGDRTPSAEKLRWAREYLGFRFPALAGAPLLEARVCQYENTPDFHLVLDRHPRAENVWLLGGGSGHGFKLGPVVGERAAETVLGRREADRRFGLARLADLA